MTQAAPRIVIKNKNQRKTLNLKELLRYKDLLYFMVLRDIAVLYKQSILGFAWAFINPFFSMIVFSVVFGKLAGIPSDGIPYPIFSYAALIPWTYFSGALNASGNSLIGGANIFTKVYFPRLIIPLVPVISKLVDFAISFILLVALMFYYHFYPTPKLLFLPFLLCIMLIATIGLGAWLSSLAVQYRDIKYGISFAVPLLMYAAPVVFPASLILDKFNYHTYLAYGIYPMVGVIEGFRAIIIPDKPMPWDLIGMSTIGALLLFFAGIRIFNKLENRFADVA